MPRYALLLRYDGSDFAGWWRQVEARTVADTCDAAFDRLGEPTARPVGAARTDAGVHAHGQVAHVDTSRDWVVDELHRQLDGQLPDDCQCLGVRQTPPDWHAAHAAQGKTYTYHLQIGPSEDPFERRWQWRLPQATDPELLQRAGTLLSGSFNAIAFARRGEHRANLDVTIRSVEWQVHGERLVCALQGDRFTYRLIRSLMGACVAVASGAASLDDLQQALDGRPGPISQQQAPAKGLHLVKVHYDPDPFG